MSTPPTRRDPPDGSPYLTPATHLTPEDGTCLMEAVSVAAGLPWSDSPPCTHALLAHLAQLVNDGSSDAARQALCVFIPDLAAASSGDPAADARASARLALACTSQALDVRPTPLLAHLSHVATARLRQEQASGRHRGLAASVQRRVFQTGPGARAVEQSVHACARLEPEARDAALHALLRAGIAAVASECHPPGGTRSETHR